MTEPLSYNNYHSYLSPFKLIIFDCDGVLLDSEDIGGRVEVEALRSLGIPIDLETYNQRFPGVLSAVSMKTVAQEHGISIQEDWIEDVRQRVLDALEKEVKIIPHIQEALQNIPVPKAVASNSELSRLSQLLYTRKLDQYFNGRIFSAEMVDRPKPYPDLYQYIARKMGVLPSECLVIEDSPTGTQAAHEAGMKVLGFMGTAQATEAGDQTLFKAGAEVVFNDMLILPKLIEVESHYIN